MIQQLKSSHLPIRRIAGVSAAIAPLRRFPNDSPYARRDPRAPTITDKEAMTMSVNFTRPIKPRIVSAGETIIREGESGTTLYIVIDGLVEVLVGATPVATVGPGGIIGEMAVITGQPRSATIVARATTWLAPIDARHFAHLVQNTPYFASQLLEQLSERLHEADHLIASGQRLAAVPATRLQSRSNAGRGVLGRRTRRPPSSDGEIETRASR
jgi:CRP-like cAMP-binding protein